MRSMDYNFYFVPMDLNVRISGRKGKRGGGNLRVGILFLIVA